MFYGLQRCLADATHLLSQQTAHTSLGYEHPAGGGLFSRLVEIARLKALSFFRMFLFKYPKVRSKSGPARGTCKEGPSNQYALPEQCCKDPGKLLERNAEVDYASVVPAWAKVKRHRLRSTVVSSHKAGDQPSRTQTAPR